MKRRNFLSVSSAIAGAAALQSCGAPPPSDSSAKPQKKPIRMHVGTQHWQPTPENLQYIKRHGVDHIACWPLEVNDATMADDFSRAREMVEKAGLHLDAVAPPLLAGPPVAAILLGKDPDRDREIEYIQNLIQACAKSGIPAFKYNMRVLFGVRSGLTPGRGGSTYSTWKFEQVKNDPPEPEVGEVKAAAFWERITYYLDRVIPVCNEYKVRAMCHPHDPGVPPSGYKGVDRVLGAVDGLKEFVSIQESPYHGLNLCLGTTAEMLRDPARELPDVIRYFGERQKIFNIHFRNIRGKRDDFMEVWQDEGDMNMVELAQVLYEVDYPYMLMPDHMPRHDDDHEYRQGFAWGYGYIKGVLQALETLT
ncbi:MAG: mannonate dehydratase [Acidobacteria bacterium]|nr:mannonate dehydratase [Acidobacteriota bacterium]